MAGGGGTAESVKNQDVVFLNHNQRVAVGYVAIRRRNELINPVGDLHFLDGGFGGTRGWIGDADKETEQPEWSDGSEHERFLPG